MNDLSRRERKKLETRAAILQAADDLFQSQGIDTTSIDEIAQAADVSRGTFFNYFPSKEVLLGELAQQEMQTLEQRMQVDLAGMPNALDRVYHLLGMFMSEQEPFLRVTRRVLLENLLRPSDIPSPIDRMAHILADLVEQAQAQGDVRADVPAGVAAQAILGAHLTAWAFGHWMRVPVNAQPLVALLEQGLKGSSSC